MYGYIRRLLPSPWAEVFQAVFFVMLIAGILMASVVPSADFQYGQH